MKRMFGLLMALVMVLSMAVGCGSNEDVGKTPEQGTQAETLKYPESTVNFIVPFSAGGGTDTMARAVTSVLDLGVCHRS